MAGYIGSKTVNLSTTGADIDGNITISGNVDGRDVAALGTKLDTVEANAKDDQTAAEIRALVAAASDSNVFTDADHSKLNGLEATGDVTDATNVAAAGALMRSGGAMTGAITTNSTFDGVDIATRDAVLTATTTTANAALPKAGGAVTGNVTFGDNDKAIFGAGSDLEIYHDGSHSYIKDVGQGNLSLTGNNLYLQTTTGETYFSGISDGAVALYHNNAAKIATKATGVTVTGVLSVSDGSSSAPSITNTGDSNTGMYFPAADTIQFTTNGTAGLKINSDRNLVYLDGTFQINSDAQDAGIFIAGGNNSNDGGNFNMFGPSHASLANVTRFRQDTVESMRITAAGDFLIGTQSVIDAGAGTQDGFSFSAGDRADFSRNNNPPLDLRRRGNDGAILNLYKDTTNVGSIGSRSGVVSTLVLDPRTNGVGLTASSNTIMPTTNTGSLPGAVVDLGASGGYAFRDLYLSGGVYLGGTGAANKLDDYETGSWAPSFNGYTTGFNGFYTKIGDLVTCRITRWSSIASGSISGNIIITGLPFTAEDNGTSNGSGQNTHQMHIRGAAGGQANAPFGMIHGASVYLHLPSSFGGTNNYAGQAATYNGSKITQNGNTSIILDYTFTYRT
jgi:hypothetical protein